MTILHTATTGSRPVAVCCNISISISMWELGCMHKIQLNFTLALQHPDILIKCRTVNTSSYNYSQPTSQGGQADTSVKDDSWYWKY